MRVAQREARTRACLSLKVSNRSSCVSFVSPLAASSMKALVLVSESECCSLRSGCIACSSAEDEDERRISDEPFRSPSVGGALSAFSMFARQRAEQRQEDSRTPEQRLLITRRGDSHSVASACVRWRRRKQCARTPSCVIDNVNDVTTRRRVCPRPRKSHQCHHMRRQPAQATRRSSVSRLASMTTLATRASTDDLACSRTTR